MPDDVKKNIIGVLRKHPEGLTFLDVAKLVHLHRHTVTKYIYELTGEKKIIQRKVGPATLCYIYRDNFLKGQHNFVSGAMIFTIFISALVLIQSLGGIGGFSITGLATSDQIITEVADEETPIEALGEAEAQGTTSVETTTTEETTTSVGTTTTEAPTTVTTIEETTTVETTINVTTTIEETSTTAEVNETTTTEETTTSIEVNETTTTEATTTTETSIEETTTTELIVEETTSTVSIEALEIQLIYPEKLVRGEDIELSAILIHTNEFSLTASVDWQLPEGFDIISSQACGIIQPGASCYDNITVQTSLSVGLGVNDIKAVVNYGA